MIAKLAKNQLQFKQKKTGCDKYVEDQFNVASKNLAK